LLDSKRSNAINISLTTLPHISLIKTAVMNMDQSIMNKEAVEKILNHLLPTEEERTKLIEAQLNNPDVPLGTAEQFLITISNISEVRCRLQLWLFLLEFESIENVGCKCFKFLLHPANNLDGLSDLKESMKQVRTCKTLKYALTVLLAVGNCLNNNQTKGFTLDFLSKVNEIKDSIRRRSLLQHLVSFVVGMFPEGTDVYSEVPAVTRCSRIDWDELDEKLKRLEVGCKSSWDHVRTIVKHDNNLNLKKKLSNVLCDYAERTILMKIIHKRVMNRFREFVLYMGYAAKEAREIKINEFYKLFSEFSLEWRTTRLKVLHNRKKKEAEKAR
ncbi:hypothetical protein HELRODRAFT_141663, partial [Helobdella robusta]|uniref:FH2 domain-containing protein n=1 Tax=Helobdella robusta TaxID=6412 RepID=T1EJ38_HELRO